SVVSCMGVDHSPWPAVWAWMAAEGTASRSAKAALLRPHRFIVLLPSSLAAKVARVWTRLKAAHSAAFAAADGHGFDDGEDGHAGLQREALERPARDPGDE